MRFVSEKIYYLLFIIIIFISIIVSTSMCARDSSIKRNANINLILRTIARDFSALVRSLQIIVCLGFLGFTLFLVCTRVHKCVRSRVQFMYLSLHVSCVCPHPLIRFGTFSKTVGQELFKHLMSTIRLRIAIRI